MVRKAKAKVGSSNGNAVKETKTGGKSKVDASESSRKMRKQENVDSNGKETESQVKDSVKEQSTEVVQDVKTSKSRKRKAVIDKEKVLPKPKAKKQKSLLEIPQRNAESGTVFVLGQNDVGQLGFGEHISDKKRPALLDLPHSVVDIAAGGMHSICLTADGQVITFGCNDEGALGRITAEEGSEHIPQIVDIPERIVQVTAGDSHSAALSESGQVYIWGNFRNINGPMGLVSNGSKECTPVQILTNVIVVKIASGSDHLVCLSREGHVYTCGCGDTGQLGRISEHASINGGRKGMDLLLKPVNVAVSNKTCTVNDIWTGSYATFLNVQETNQIYAFGLNNFCQLGVENINTIWKPKLVTSFNNHTWLHISGGQHHTITLNNNGLVCSLGRSEYGRLGLGEDSGEKSLPTTIPSLDEKCTHISCGNCVSFAVTENGSLFSWGMGTNHQLGHGDESDQYLPRLIEGNFFNSWKAVKISGGGQHTLILAHPKS